MKPPIQTLECTLQKFTVMGYGPSISRLGPNLGSGNIKSRLGNSDDLVARGLLGHDACLVNVSFKQAGN
jgi:hypothetical protein